MKKCFMISLLCLTGFSFGNSRNVQPLLKTQWAQRGLYAAYTPGQERLGCWSVAFAQILFFHRINPTGKVEYNGNEYAINETLDYQFMWDYFEKTLKSESSEKSRSEVARYCYYTAIAIQKDFDNGEGYKGNSDLRRQRIKKYFQCNTRRYGNDRNSDRGIREVILTELAAGRPLLLYLEGKKGLGHAFVIDG
ncbi:MAG: C10 family peptidase, partial [Planctomycetota bacterium]